MARLPDLVEDSKLGANILPHFNVTIHTYRESDPDSRRRLVSRSEHWQRQKKIGAGSYASVWLEKCVEGGRHGASTLRAVKQIDLSRSGQKPGFYHRELEAIAKFSHSRRCFVKSFGWYESLDNLYIAMEYLEIGDLYDYMNRRSPLSETEARQITYQILEGLGMMHENAFTHRDLKPNNILIKSHPPNEWWVKIADFGISKRIGEDLGTASSTLRGTPGYMAPELYGFIERGSPYAVDIWSLGEITFDILTKTATFESLGQLFSYVDNSTSFPTHLLKKSSVSQDGIDFILALMQPDPSSRPTAHEAISLRWIKNLLHPQDCSEMTQNMEGDEIISLSSANMSIQGRGIQDSISNFLWMNKAAKQDIPPALSAFYDLVCVKQDSRFGDAVIIGSLGSKIDLYQTLQDNYRQVNSAAFSPDRRYVATASDDSTVIIWDISRGVEIRSVREHTDPVNNVIFNPKTGLLVCATVSGVELWGPPSGLKLSVLQPPLLHVQNIIISPDGRYIAFSTNKATVGIRGLDTDTNITLPIKCRTMMFTPDNEGLMIAADEIFFWELKSGNVFEVTTTRGWHHKLLSFSPNARLLASVSSFGSSTEGEYIALWDTTTGEQLFRIRNLCPDRVNSMIFSPNGKLLVTGEIGGIHFWDIATGEELHRIEDDPLCEIKNLSFSVDGTMLLSCIRAGPASTPGPAHVRYETVKIWKGIMVDSESA
ncbi:Tetratricopeptide-like helical [Penicillium malachiteum]|uniref:Tetratricopeptide-like helical n=1 Tax=Penicillium malachiteum TaxID=1324776 RepID=UPI0025480D22|nr:Tetratricopeptide-like helical [Penicillium malachiteum]KAJ5730855.1 Tetratricopeptide-like helical [Penicillium malachiteum]